MELYYISFKKRFEIMVGATIRKNLGFSMPKQSDNSCPGAIDNNMHFLCSVKVKL